MRIKVIKSIHNMKLVETKDYTTKNGESRIINYYENSLGYKIDCVGTAKREIGKLYPITLTLIDKNIDGTSVKNWYYTEFKPDDRQPKEKQEAKK